MWQLIVPVAICASGGDGMLMAIAGVLTLVLLQQRARPPPLRVYGPELYASARVSETESGEESKTSVEEEGHTNDTERVPNPRKMSTDLTEPTETDTRRVPDTHIVGFRCRPSSESRARLLARQHKELKQYTLHQYE
jgi:hypothetical protein